MKLSMLTNAECSVQTYNFATATHVQSLLTVLRADRVCVLWNFSYIYRLVVILVIPQASHRLRHTQLYIFSLGPDLPDCLPLNYCTLEEKD